MSPATVLAQVQPLNAAGALVMVGCIGFVLALCGFCFWRILRRPASPEGQYEPPETE